jgi:hypothetical protein
MSVTVDKVEPPQSGRGLRGQVRLRQTRPGRVGASAWLSGSPPSHSGRPDRRPSGLAGPASSSSTYRTPGRRQLAGISSSRLAAGSSTTMALSARWNSSLTRLRRSCASRQGTRRRDQPARNCEGRRFDYPERPDDLLPPRRCEQPQQATVQLADAPRSRLALLAILVLISLPIVVVFIAPERYLVNGVAGAIK